MANRQNLCLFVLLCYRNVLETQFPPLMFSNIISTHLRALLLRNWEKNCVHMRRTEMMLILLLFYGIFTLGVNIFLLECPAEPWRGKARAGSSSVWGTEGFCSLGIWRCLKYRYGCIELTGVVLLTVNSIKDGDSHHPSSSHRDAGRSMLLALCWWGVGRRKGERGVEALGISHVIPSFLTPFSPPSQGGHHKQEIFHEIIDSVKPTSNSIQLVFQWILGQVSLLYGPVVAVLIANSFPTAAFKQWHFISLQFRM